MPTPFHFSLREKMILNPEELAKIKNKLTKVMALSASPNEAEAALAMEKCQEIMTKYGIRTIDVDPVEKTCETSEAIVNSMENSIWEKLLAVNVAKALDGIAISIPMYNGTRKTSKFSLCFIAGNTDIEIITNLYLRLRRNIGAMSIKYCSTLPARTKDIYISYCHGVVISVGKNLSKVYAAPTESTTALVVIKTDAVNEKMNKLFPGIKNKSIKPNISKINTDAFLQGLEDGESVGVHTSVIQ